jgi:hypothetical protein
METRDFTADVLYIMFKNGDITETTETTKIIIDNVLGFFYVNTDQSKIFAGANMAVNNNYNVLFLNKLKEIENKIGFTKEYFGHRPQEKFVIPKDIPEANNCYNEWIKYLKDDIDSKNPFN